MPFACRVAIRYRVPLDPELPFERLGQPRGQRVGDGVGRLRHAASLGWPVQRRGDAQRPTDLRSREEPLAADVERDARRAEARFQGRQLGIRADEDRHVAVGDAIPGERPDGRRDPGELRIVRVEARDVRRRPAIERRHEPLLRSRHRSRSALVARRSSRGQHAVREAQHLRRRSEIALQPHDPGLRVAGGEARQVVARGPGERVDRLVLVADDREVVAAAEPGVEQRLLERVRVLVLVDREPSIARPDLGGDSLVALDQLHGHRQHVLEVDEPGPVAGGLVVPVEAEP